MGDTEEISESDCCGNGCANCVLNIEVKNTKLSNLSGKKNILDNYTKFRVLSKTLHSIQASSVWELHLKSQEPAETGHVLHINPGYHIMMRRKLSADEQESSDSDDEERWKSTNEMKRIYLLRPYSPFWWDAEEMEFKILVNLKLQGPMSNYIRALQVNDEVEIRGPIGTLLYEADGKGDQQLLILTQGVAIAPAIPIVENILYNDDDLTRITHVACFQDMNNLFFREKMNGFQKYWNYKAYIFLAHEICDSDPKCAENGTCLETCIRFVEKIKYKEPIKPLRLSTGELEKIIQPIKLSSDKMIAIIAGSGTFQVYFKGVMEKHNIETYLL